MNRAKLFFRDNPFPAAPSADRYVTVGSVEHSRRRLMDTIDRREGIGLIVGPTGTGKSLLCSLIAEEYRDQFDVVQLAESRLCTRRALLQHLLHHLGMPYAGLSEGELRLSLIDRAASGGPDARQGLLIIVDEGQAVPSRLLEELRMMAGIVRNGLPRVQLLVAGSPSLDERLSHPRMEAFSQRIGARCYLHPLGYQETDTYIRQSLQRGGVDPAAAIDDEAIQAVYFASGGIARLINQTMGRAVTMAQSDGSARLTGEIVERAWADLQQLPSPVVTEAGGTAPLVPRDPTTQASQQDTAAIVEFGSLEEEAPLDKAFADCILYNSTAAAERTAERETALFVSANDHPVRDPLADTVDYEPQSSMDEEVGKADAEERSLATPATGEYGADEDAGLGDAGDRSLATPATGECAGDRSLATPATGECAEDRSLATPATAGSGEDEQAEMTDVGALFGDGFEDEQWISAAPQPMAQPFRPHASGPAATPLLKVPFAAADYFTDSVLEIKGAAPQGAADELSLHSEILSINSDLMGGQWQQTLEEVSGDITIRDDSDMLVIEEDLEVEDASAMLPRRPARAIDSEGDQVDYQDLFSRLRKG